MAASPLPSTDPLHACPRCGSLNLAPSEPHAFFGEPCSGVPREPYRADCSPEHHARLKSSPELLAILDYVGRQQTEDDEGRPVTLELRNCGCKSTLAIELPQGARV